MSNLSRKVSRRYKPIGDYVDTLEAIAAEAGVSRTTAKNALRLAHDEQFVEVRQEQEVYEMWDEMWEAWDNVVHARMAQMFEPDEDGDYTYEQDQAAERALVAEGMSPPPMPRPALRLVLTKRLESGEPLGSPLVSYLGAAARSIQCKN